MSAINSPFRYAGGKFYARKLILEYIPPHTHYVEPFAGGASIFFAKDKVSYNYLNDIDQELINVFKTLRDHSEELISLLSLRSKTIQSIPVELYDIKSGNTLPASKELHTFFKNSFTPYNDLERALRWFYLNRTSYSGIMNVQNMYWGYGDKYSMQPKNWPANIQRTSKKLQDVKLTSLDFEVVIDNAPDGSFLFVDPPYFRADQDKFYNHAFSKDDHFRLCACLKRNANRVVFFLTYDNVDEIRALYHWVEEIHDREWNYCIQRTDDQRNGTNRKGERYKGKELFILSYKSTMIEMQDQLLLEV